MSFVLEHVENFPAACHSGLIIFSTPAVDRRPPKTPHPFVETGLRPLPVRPPPCSKLGGIPRRGDRENLVRHLLLKNSQRPNRVVVGCNQQNSFCAFAGEAPSH